MCRSATLGSGPPLHHLIQQAIAGQKPPCPAPQDDPPSSRGDAAFMSHQDGRSNRAKPAAPPHRSPGNWRGQPRLGSDTPWLPPFSSIGDRGQAMGTVCQGEGPCTPAEGEDTPAHAAPPSAPTSGKRGPGQRLPHGVDLRTVPRGTGSEPEPACSAARAGLEAAAPGNWILHPDTALCTHTSHLPSRSCLCRHRRGLCPAKPQRTPCVPRAGFPKHLHWPRRLWGYVGVSQGAAGWGAAPLRAQESQGSQLTLPPSRARIVLGHRLQGFVLKAHPETPSGALCESGLWGSNSSPASGQCRPQTWAFCLETLSSI